MQDAIACAMVMDWPRFANIVFGLYQTVIIIGGRKIISKHFKRVKNLGVISPVPSKLYSKLS